MDGRTAELAIAAELERTARLLAIDDEHRIKQYMQMHGFKTRRELARASMNPLLQWIKQIIESIHD